MRTSSDNERRPTTLQTVERALAFLEVVAQAPQPPTVKETAATLGLNVTTGYHLFNTLHQAGYLVRDRDGALRIGSRVALLHQGLVRQFVLGRDLHPVLEELSRETGETSYLASSGKGGVVIQAVVEGDQAVRVNGLYVGFSGAEHLRASGKAVLAHLDADHRDAVLARCLADSSAAERHALQAELTTVHERGWALDDGDYQEGVSCIAVPFFRAGGMVEGSITVSTPSSRFPASRDLLTRSVLNAARRASELLGHYFDARVSAG